jgi:hypothetical protein
MVKFKIKKGDQLTLTPQRQLAVTLKTPPMLILQE